MSDRIQTGLERLFEEHRIVFWYDAAREMREAYVAADLPGVEKIEIANNEFGLKYRMLRQEPKQKFLLFKDGPEPEMKDNWLLDLQLATAVFKADQTAIWLAELGLPGKYEPAVRDHMEFFRSARRLERLKEMEAEQPSDSVSAVQRKMLAVCADADGAMDTVIEALLGGLAEERDDALRLMERAGLTEFFWKQVANAYGYVSNEPDFEDFAITLFQSCYCRALGEDGKLNSEALLVFRRWKNNRLGAEAFETLSRKYQVILRIPEDLRDRDIKALRTIDHFEEIDRQIIRLLVAEMSSQTVTSAEVLKTVRERRQSHWYPIYRDVYEAIGYATEFQQALAEATLGMTSPAEGVKRYVSSGFKIDQHYRKFIYHMQKSGQASLLGSLFESVENRYTTNFLLAVNDAWQDQMEHLSDWAVPGYPKQTDFYRDQSAEFRRRDQKVVVIISDALRYEVAEECQREIRKLPRYDAELKPMIAALPSYTQLGMAALLPNEALTLSGDATVLSFGEPTQGTANRQKILGKGRAGDQAKAMKAEDFMNMKADEGKALFRDHDILYLYHNRIDIVGDKLATEDRVTEAAEDAIEDLTKLVRKLTTANFSNILITADHGFLYQHRALDETDFSVADPTGSEILFKNRRFVIGRGLNETAGMKKFSSAELGLAGDLDVLIPNSINRMRVKGAGSRFVHGGATLQEVVIPVLRVGKRREADVGKVDVQIIAPSRSLISSGQTAVALYQAQPVSEKQQQRNLMAGIYAQDGTLISDEHQLTFDFTSQNPRERELPITFLLSRAADSFNNQDVFLKLRERVGKTSHFDDYTSHRFQLRRGISTDFDF
ncbi:BREX-1 system phosphatase PglZ type A [Lentibacter sp. XHP0401]|uniref:BREX-1 system phosphatase PglZ type A n=1 Tax=Lentibacter sp. XHP0401 TaxID=2984334 RepID=UPI0021E9959F|nr:BREX-1 system phosphatase PglZ type A [Lentibacter sp. XHP0401]MCV2893716.1 BREX-1 system phosphatase PglZ type A [Lentibacter sp. XHP0401]